MFSHSLMMSDRHRDTLIHYQDDNESFFFMTKPNMVYLHYLLRRAAQILHDAGGLVSKADLLYYTTQKCVRTLCVFLGTRALF